MSGTGVVSHEVAKASAAIGTLAERSDARPSDSSSGCHRANRGAEFDARARDQDSAEESEHSSPFS